MPDDYHEYRKILSTKSGPRFFMKRERFIGQNVLVKTVTTLVNTGVVAVLSFLKLNAYETKGLLMIDC